MTRTTTTLLALALTGVLALFATNAVAGDKDDDDAKTALASKCYPMERILVSAGEKDTQIAGAAQQLLNKMRSEGLEDFIVLEAGGHKVLCGSPD